MSNLIVNTGRTAANVLFPGWGGLIYDTALSMAQGAPAPRDVPRLSELQLLRVSEGAPIPRVYGRVRLGGQVIWTAAIRAHAHHSGGGKGRGSRVTSYSYTLTFAVGICEGPIGHIGRIWADGELLSSDHFDWRIYRGDESQMPDEAVVLAHKEKFAPAFRGLAYIVFENFNLTAFGNRIPQLNFEVFSPVEELSNKIQAISILPTAGEFGYHTTIRSHFTRSGIEQAQNAHVRQYATNWTESLDALQNNCANVQWVCLPVYWFGNDLRGQLVKFLPKTARPHRIVTGGWNVAGLSSSQMKMISKNERGRATYLGTPSDNGVVEAIRDLRARGLKVMLYPQILMDIDAAVRNIAPNNDQSIAPHQFPWCGEIRIVPPSGSTAQTGAAFVRTAMTRLFSGTLGSLSYMLLHYAKLCKQAGGVDAFLLCGQLAKLSRARINVGAQGNLADRSPFAIHLKTLGGQIRSILGNEVKLSYGAHWSEYGGRHVQILGATTGTKEFAFPLDEYWASSAADFVAVDGAFPLSDFRNWKDEGRATADPDTRRAEEIGLQAYFEENIVGGEYHNWQYKTQADRANRTRTNIRTANTPWQLSWKDFPDWWRNTHMEDGRSQQQHKTSWKPRSKQIWLVGVRCGAVDKGSNEPDRWKNTILGDTALPFASKGTRNDDIQRTYLRAVLNYWNTPRKNPANPKGLRVIAADKIFVHGWEARPYPTYPYNWGAWHDEVNWPTGFSLQGRLSQAPLMGLMRRIGQLAHKTISLKAKPSSPEKTEPLSDLEGYVIEKITTPASILMPLLQAFFLEPMLADSDIIFRHRGNLPIHDLDDDDLVMLDDADDMEVTIKDATALPTALKLTYWSNEKEFRPNTIEARLESKFYQTTQIDLPLVLRSEQAQNIADTLLREIWVARETARFSLRLSCLHLQVGDVVRLREKLWRIQRLTDRGVLDIEAVRHQPEIYNHAHKYEIPSILPDDIVPKPEEDEQTLIIRYLNKGPQTRGPAGAAGQGADIQDVPASGLAVTTDIRLHLADLPNLGFAPPGIPLIAASADPWPRDLIVTPPSESWTTNVPTATILGVTCAPFTRGPVGRWDYAHTLDVRLRAGELESYAEAEILAGRNQLAVRTPAGWEILQFVYAKLIDNQCYRLSKLLRGQAGSDAVMVDSLPAGAPVIMLSRALVPLVDSINQLEDSMTLHYGQIIHETSRQYWREQKFVPAYVGHKPLSPVHVRATRHANGDIALAWTRRSRVRADSWTNPVPLGEPREAYRLRIMRAAKTLRQVECSNAGYLYTLAQQNMDGLANQPVQLELVQLGDVVAQGYPAQATLNLATIRRQL